MFCSSVKLQGPKSIPDHWDPSALPDIGFKVWDWRCLGLGRGVFSATDECERLRFPLPVSDQGS